MMKRLSNKKGYSFELLFMYNYYINKLKKKNKAFNNTEAIFYKLDDLDTRQIHTWHNIIFLLFYYTDIYLLFFCLTLTD